MTALVASASGTTPRLVYANDLDAALLRYRALAERFHRGALDFELCAGYVIQATREGFWAAAVAGTLVVGTFRHGRSAPAIVGAVGPNRAWAMATVAHDLARASGAPLTVKNVGCVLAEALSRLGARPYAPGEGWDRAARYDDNTFPEQILDTSALTALTGQRFKKLRNERHAFRRQHPCRVAPLVEGRPVGLEALAGRWAEHIGRRRRVATAAVLAATRVLLAPRSDLIHYGVFEEGTDALVGVLGFSRISAACLGFNVLVHDPTYRNAFRVFALEGARLAQQAGYRWLNLQGSEDSAQDRSKRKLRPVHALSKTHLVFDPPSS